MERKFKVGDVVANRFGHVLSISSVEEDGWVVGNYELNPTVYYRYREETLRLLSRIHGVSMEGWESQGFADRIRRSMEWARTREREAPTKTPKGRSEGKPLDLSALTTEQLLKLLEGGEG